METKFKKGKLYNNFNAEMMTQDHHLVILCTEDSDTNLEGVVVSANNKIVDHKVGTYIKTWNKNLFSENIQSHHSVVLSNDNYDEKDYMNLSCQG